MPEAVPFDQQLAIRLVTEKDAGGLVTKVISALINVEVESGHSLVPGSMLEVEIIQGTPHSLIAVRRGAGRVGLVVDHGLVG